MTRFQARRLRKNIEKASVSLSDTDALNSIELFPQWESGQDYEIGKRLRYANKLYRVVQTHTSQSDWTPDLVPALFVEVAEPGTIPVWVQPTGAQDAYNTGDQVHYPTIDGPVYESIIDNNTWSPEAYPAGWRLIEG